MDGLVVLFIIIAVFSSIASKSKKLANQQGARGANPAGRQTAAQPRRRAAQPTESGVQKSTLTAMERPDTRAPLAQPRIHARVDEPYVGSLGGASSEGMASGEGTDPCHDEQMEAHRQAYAIHDSSTLRPAIEVVPSLNTPQALVQAVVLNEILARPGQRGRVRL